MPTLPSNFQSTFISVILATIPLGSDTSGSISLYGTTGSAIFMPSAFTGTTISFLASPDGVNFFPLYDELGVLISYVVAPSTCVRLRAGDFYPIRYLKIKSNAVEAAARILTLQPFSI